MCSKFKIGTKKTSMVSFWCLYTQLRTYFTSFSSAPTVDIEQVKCLLGKKVVLCRYIMIKNFDES